MPAVRHVRLASFISDAYLSDAPEEVASTADRRLSERTIVSMLALFWEVHTIKKKEREDINLGVRTSARFYHKLRSRCFEWPFYESLARSFADRLLARQFKSNANIVSLEKCQRFRELDSFISIHFASRHNVRTNYSVL